jgi:leukotriene-A4 hydrolase
MFLYHLEELLGGVEVFNKFLKDYIQNFKGMSIDTDDFKAFLYEYFNDKVFLNDIICLNT